MYTNDQKSYDHNVVLAIENLNLHVTEVTEMIFKKNTCAT